MQAPQVRPRGPIGWPAALRHEALIRRLRSSPAVIAEFVDSERPPRLTRAAAAACVLAACEVLADLHAGGFAGIFDPWRAPVELRVRADGSIAWRICELAARREPAAEVSQDDLDALFGDDIGPIAEDLRGLLRRFPELHGDRSRRTPEQAATLAAIDGLFADADAACLVSAARVARLVAALTDRPAEWRGRVAALPVVRTLPPISFDWDAIVDEGEAMLAEHARGPYYTPGCIQVDAGSFIVVPLATAYHRRASRAFAQGDAVAALRDIERALALDAYFPLHTTRALVLDALGRASEARAAAEVAVEGQPGAHRDGLCEPDHDRELARAHATRGSFALRDGALTLAEADLRRACAHAPDPMYTHTLAAVLHAAGDLAGAAALSAEAVAMAPDDARLRWALAVRLDRLGRADEAREHAGHALARAPDLYAGPHARRFA